MMRWKSLLAVAVSSVLFGACTVTTGSGDGSDDDSFEDDDDVQIDDQETTFDDDFEDDDFQDPDELDDDTQTDTDAGPTDDETTTDETTSETTDTGETTSEEDGGDATDETTSDSTETDAGTTDDTTDDTTETGETTDEGDGGPAACMLPEAEPPACEACLAESCGTEYEACFCDPTCAAELEAVRTCYAEKNTLDNPSEDQAGDWAVCEEMAQGDDGELSTTYYDLLSCAGAPYMPADESAEDPYGRTMGDGTCTAACFGLFSFPE